MDSWKPLDTIPAPPITEVDNKLQMEFSQEELYFTQVVELDSNTETIPYNEPPTLLYSTIPILEKFKTDEIIINPSKGGILKRILNFVCNIFFKIFNKKD